MHVLPAYQRGHFLHPGTVKFCRIISQEIMRLNSEGKKVTVIVTGHADGLRNKGVPRGREQPGEKCSQIAQHQTINDEELAKLRGCAVWDVLSFMLDKQGIVLFGANTSQYEDIEDGGPSGNPYRKVVVEVVYQ